VALVVQGVSGRRRDGVLDRYQDSTHQVGVAGVLHIAANGHYRDLIRGGVDVARYDDLATWYGGVAWVGVCVNVDARWSWALARSRRQPGPPRAGTLACWQCIGLCRNDCYLPGSRRSSTARAPRKQSRCSVSHVPYPWLTCQFARRREPAGPLTTRLERPAVGPPKPLPPTPGKPSVPILTSTDGAVRLTQD
jgi:hypothetical protein